MYGDSKRAQRLYQQDSDAEEEEDLQPNPKLGAGKATQIKPSEHLQGIGYDELKYERSEGKIHVGQFPQSILVGPRTVFIFIPDPRTSNESNEKSCPLVFLSIIFGWGFQTMFLILKLTPLILTQSFTKYCSI